MVTKKAPGQQGSQEPPMKQTQMHAWMPALQAVLIWSMMIEQIKMSAKESLALQDQIFQQ